jgi:signal transduction histidine kinase
MTVLGLVVAGASLVCALVVARLLRLAPTLRLQLVGLALFCVCVPLGAVLLSGWVMFHMGADLKILAVAAGAAAAGALAAVLVARSVARPVELVGAASARLATGDLSVRAPEGGPAEVARLAAAFNEMAGQLERLFDARRELVSWASHDLRTPLTSMQAMLEAVEDGLAEPADYLPSLREQVRTLSSLVDDLFELTRIDNGLLTLELQETALGELVDASLHVLAPEAAARRVALEAHVEEPSAARVAPDQIERVLVNLLTNAVRHTPPDGSVAVRVARTDGGLVVHVEDTGEGLPHDAPARMFDRFWRADRSRSGSNAGLGLAIAGGLVEAHGGHIWAENRPQGGARVSFTLPAT